MLFATYQPVYRSPDDFIADIRPESDRLGFPPIWCMPITSPADLFAESMFCNPNSGDAFYIIKSDNYISVDKLENYRNIAHNEHKHIDELIVPNGSLPDRHCEFILSAEEVMRGLLYTCGVTELQDYRNIIATGFSEEGLEHVRGAIWHSASHVINHPMRRTSVTLPPDATLSSGTLEEFTVQRSRRRHYKLAFETSVLVVLANAALYGRASPAHAYAVSGDFVSYYNLQNKMNEWAVNDGTVDGYDLLYNQAKGMVINSPEVIARLIEGKTPGRNEACPCGSGKKWKRCHGTASFSLAPIWGDSVNYSGYL